MSTSTQSRQEIPVQLDRSSGAAALFGLIAAFLVGFSTVGSGIAYLLWPRAAAQNVPQISTTAIPEELPSDIERPKNLNEILKEPPPGGAGRQNPDLNPGFNRPLPGEPLVPPPLPPGKLGPRQ